MKEWLDLLDKNRDDMAIGFMSSPGVGKTTMINDWAREHDRKVVEIVLSQRMPSEISGMPMPISDERKMDVFDYDALLSLEDGDILFLDEFPNGNIQTLNACLTLIQDRTMHKPKTQLGLLHTHCKKLQPQLFSSLPQERQV